MSKRETINVLGTEIAVISSKNEDYPDFNRMEFHTVKNADEHLVLTPKYRITWCRILTGNK